MNLLIRLGFFIALVLGSGNYLCASSYSFAPPVISRQDSLPVPKEIKNMLFYMQRDPNANTVVYQLNLTEQDIPNEKEPIDVFWIRYAEDGQRKELNYFQNKLAYGLNVKKISPERYEFQFVSYPKLTFQLKKGTDGKYHVYAPIGQKQAILKRVFVRIEGGTFWVPNVLYVDIIGVDMATGKEITERITP